MYVCLCRGVTDRAIARAINEGACTVEEVAVCTGAGTKCGRCRPEIAEMIASRTVALRRISLTVLPEGALAQQRTRAA